MENPELPGASSHACSTAPLSFHLRPTRGKTKSCGLSSACCWPVGELGTDGSCNVGEDYQGVAMTLIDSMSTLAVLGNASEFEKQVHWLIHHVSIHLRCSISQFELH